MNFRSHKIEKAYHKHRQDLGHEVCLLCDGLKAKVTKNFKHWVILSNKFPYDKIAKNHDLLVIKNHIASLDKLSKEESEELFKIKTTHLPKMNYCLILENLPKRQSVKGHYHFHLVELKD